ncbi:hypothetical protein AB1Y20_003998 [Prymnesium parvum]|uniref:Cation/H+ exchanger transmembrane domain-containing protein n=1 Tax=Prymnesium parvum TaxID=97485 RepID=A0AB34J6A1_PRYPA
MAALPSGPASPPTPPPIPPWQFTNCQVDHCNENSIIAIFCGIFICALLVPPLVSRIKCQQAEVLTETSTLMLLGFLFGVLWWGINQEQPHVSQSAFVHDIIYYLLLPPIIFEAGFTMRKRKFFANFGRILLYAILGTLIAILAAGGMLFALVHAGAIGTEFTFNELMLFASLISSTDPISTLATLKAVHAQPPLEDLIFGESALNDALSIVFFNVFRALCRQEAIAAHSSDTYPPNAPALPPPPPHQDPPQEMLNMGRMLLIILPCSLLLGVIFGLLSAFITRHSNLRRARKPHAELAVLLACALGSYAFTDWVTLGGAQLSAILASFFSGITMRHYAFYNLSRRAQASAVVMFRTLSSICEVSLALLLGVATVDYLSRPSAWDGAFVGYAFLATLLARALNIFPLSGMANCVRARDDRVTCPMQVVMWFSGMRGAVSFALAMTLEDTRDVRDMISLTKASRIVTATLAAIFFTNFVMAPFTGPLIGMMKLGRSSRSSSGSTRCTSRRKSDVALSSDECLPPLLMQPTGAVPSSSGNSAELDSTQHGAAVMLNTVSAECSSLPSTCAPQPVVQQVSVLLDSETSLPIFKSNIHRNWRVFDDRYLKPIFGGHKVDPPNIDEEASDEELGS